MNSFIRTTETERNNSLRLQYLCLNAVYPHKIHIYISLANEFGLEGNSTGNVTDKEQCIDIDIILADGY